MRKVKQNSKAKDYRLSVKKGFTLALMVACFVTLTAFSCGGNGKSRKSSIYKGTGVDSIGVHVDQPCPAGQDRWQNKCIDSCPDGILHDIDGSCTVCAPKADGTRNVYIPYLDDPCPDNEMDGVCGRDCRCCGSNNKCVAWETDQDDNAICDPNAKPCTANQDCEVGEFCNITTSVKDGDSARANVGSCRPIGDGIPYVYNGYGFLQSVNNMSWWAAQNWCKAQGYSLAELIDIGFDKEEAGNPFSSCSGNCQSGDWDAIYETFKNAGARLWTADVYSRNGDGNITHSYAIDPSAKEVDWWYRYNMGTAAFCKGSAVEDRQVCNVFGKCQCTSNYTGNKCTDCVETCEKQDGKCVPKANCDEFPGTALATVSGYRGGDAGLSTDGTTFCKCPTDYKWDFFDKQCVPAAYSRCAADYFDEYDYQTVEDWRVWSEGKNECGYGYVGHYEGSIYYMNLCECRPVSDYDYENITLNGHTYTVLKNTSELFGASLFCSAIEKEVISLADLGCSWDKCHPVPGDETYTECPNDTCSSSGLWNEFVRFGDVLNVREHGGVNSGHVGILLQSHYGEQAGTIWFDDHYDFDVTVCK